MSSSWLQRLLESLGAVRTVIALLGSLAVVSFTAGMQVSAARLNALETRARRLETALDSVRADIRDIRRTNEAQLCLTVAERLRRPWQECLRGDP
jgi:hypothetical protein